MVRKKLSKLPSLLTGSKMKTVVHSDLLVRDLCIPNFITISVELTTKEAISKVRESAQHGIFYVYVVDNDKKLCGVVSVRALLVAKDNQRISEIYSPKLVALKGDWQLDQAYQEFSQAKFLSLPVVDDDGFLMGVLHAHELLDEYEKELDELFEERTRGELFELLGVQSSEDPLQSPLKIALARLPWLLVNLVGGAISAFFIHDLAGGLKEHAVLYLAFVPILLIITESMGMQTMSIVIGHLNRSTKQISLRNLYMRESVIAFLLAVACGLAIAGPVYLWKGSWQLSLTIALTIGVGFLSASTLGHLLPALFHRTKVDPQVAAGPVVLAIADAGTLIVYLLIAIAILSAAG